MMNFRDLLSRPLPSANVDGKDLLTESVDEDIDTVETEDADFEPTEPTDTVKALLKKNEAL